MKVLGRIFLNSQKEGRKEGRKDRKTERRKDGVFLWDVEELTFLISLNNETKMIINTFILHVDNNNRGRDIEEWRYPNTQIPIIFLKHPASGEWFIRVLKI